MDPDQNENIRGNGVFGSTNGVAGGTGGFVQTPSAGGAIPQDYPQTSMPMGSQANMFARPQTNTPVGMQTNVPMGSGTGDIILNGTAKPKKKVGIIVLVVLVVLAVILGVVCLIVMSTKNSGGAKISDTGKAFNRYANYLLYGEDKEDAIDLEYIESMEPEEGYLSVQIEEGDISAEYLGKLRDYYRGFYDSVSGEIGDSEYIKSFLDRYSNQVDLVYAYYTQPFLMRGSIVTQYVTDGRAAAEMYVEELSRPFDNIGDIYDENYYELAVDWGSETLSLIMKYDEMGCVSAIDGEGVVDYTCVTNNADDESRQLSQEVSEIGARMFDLVHISTDDLYLDLPDMWNIVYGDEDEEADEA